ncbi:hypothetical protein Agub_g2838 [Astrephomene gubernaculifera]|uniref:RHOMBOID-like protein n=1 Tax=Astrephomene gubernaculifera TaxID=47775 RepID=A0AAD3HIE7_9CHLO|nr:hypothetical protein Agub_g2838 [Astrephomene gubernaculifera]
MAAPAVAMVPLGPSAAAGTLAFTGSSTEYWAIVAAQQQDAERYQRTQMAAAALRRRQRVFTLLYNMLAVGELVYFIVGLYLIDWQVADLRDNPLLGPGALGIVKLGGTHTQRIIERHQYWRLVSSLFHNAGAIHLVSNLGLVWAFGHFLVRDISPWAVAATFLCSGLAGVLVSANVGAQYMSAAASIPAFGLAGAACSKLLLDWRRYAWRPVTLALLGFMLAANAFLGATPFVDNSGNSGGLVAGAVMGLGWVLVRKEKTRSRVREALLHLLAAAAMVGVLAAVVVGLVGLQYNAPVAGCCNPWVCTGSAWWDCDASRIWPSSCAFTTYLNSTATLTCPKGQVVGMGVVNRTDISSLLIQQWCDTYCNLATGISSGGGDSSSSSSSGVSGIGGGLGSSSSSAS